MSSLVYVSCYLVFTACCHTYGALLQIGTRYTTEFFQVHPRQATLWFVRTFDTPLLCYCSRQIAQRTKINAEQQQELLPLATAVQGWGLCW